MTLVYAKIESDHIWFVSDTAVTEHEAPNPNKDEVEVKFRFCGKTRFVAYAGEPIAGRKAMAEVEDIEDKRSALQILLNESLGGTVDFLLGDYDRKPTLYKISREISDMRSAYIGSKPAFETFQRCMLSGAPAGFSTEHSAMYHLTFAEEVQSDGIMSGVVAMTDAIVSGRDRSVNGFVLPGLIYSVGHFVWNYNFLTTNTISEPLVAGDVLEDNCSADGGGKWDVLTTSMNKDGFALYSPLSKVGRIFLFEKGVGYRCTRFLDCSAKSFQIAVKNRMGVDVDVGVFESNA
jgi:hypothetical protein